MFIGLLRSDAEHPGSLYKTLLERARATGHEGDFVVRYDLSCNVLTFATPSENGVTEFCSVYVIMPTEEHCMFDGKRDPGILHYADLVR